MTRHRAAAIAVVTVIAFVSHEVGMFTREQVTAPRPLTGFIWHPDVWSFIVALVAGAAGALLILFTTSSHLVHKKAAPSP